WVEYHDFVSPDISKDSQDYKHGTAVTSLIVDGANLNPNLDDGCGNFRVRHFGVSLQSGFNSFTIIKQIKEIVSQNADIKVWNLSLGSNDEIRENF
ncbi:S8 family serine peptidase, partial [Streptococcus pneumoniae]|nr:S8 family serine peptidase [Streptococcus pneumoniae]